MSLESELEANTAAINRLTAMLAGTNFSAAPQDAQANIPPLEAAIEAGIERASSEPDAPKARKPRGPNKVKEEAPAAVKAAVRPASQSPSSGVGRDEALYASLCELIVDLAEKDEKRAVGILKDFGANRAPELKPDQLERAHAAFAAALEEFDTPADVVSSLV